MQPIIMTTATAPRSLGERIQRRRRRLGILQSELARAIGYGPGAISRFERGHRVPKEVLPRLAAALQVDVGDLLADAAAIEPSREERELLRAYRALPDSGQAEIRSLMAAIAAGRVAR
ncbi:helix-turn-helix domain-containing protein [Methylobacterium nodulans]|uniref:Transcriptional regulator, XRE family n=1 Tax=Methylobacterium nodulans (strain LMG 21967 / CNCM I-2342 / ORS 2060) TaxID=460265 RepID=B8IV50_METNO|nr:helix-turn-helix domain-containing protein [Methylobacterium nodulans]ACL59108.1 transcriptional regulator, XRE family [Methylobacterium nodulans ORS 2060]